MVARDAALAGYEDARVHFQHLSCAASVDAVGRAKARGFRVSAEVTPHHLLLTEEDVRGMDTRMKMHPPLATESDRLALLEGLRAGTIDCVATDHAPHARDEKEVPFEQAPMGTTGLGDGVRGALHGPRADRRARAGAARRAHDRGGGAVRSAHPADRRRASPPTSRSWTSTPSGSPASTAGRAALRTAALPGAALTGRVLLTVAAGAIVYRERAFSMAAA